MKKQLGLSILLASLATPAMADSGFFVSGDMGLFYVSSEKEYDAVTDTVEKWDSIREVTFAGGIGYQINDYFEVELGYRDFGTDDDATSTYSNLNIGAPIAENLRLYGILGYQRIRAKDDILVDDEFQSAMLDDDEWFWGLGMAFKANENWDVRFKLLSHDAGNNPLSLSWGASYRF
ncbi:MAG: porin family protein [Cellvibrionaceae bacterium]|nr:porin family protein [Cellvibrionaceae bacterium]MCV6628095.1 porin family protein [Cellvibrionaceae bacterium]